ncbi:DUF1659 domain-containing protein [Haloimpatiens lingqiaonensis]|uniref:DUF1659 domain-containing protein n=1 Tax=Haloimpatiens lingqiaonensis TaxID=1380675 RepID=UPI0014859BF8|nr:DUF1659 domain-containing protein [Haloimpatiens lingqiaonensis]
MAVMENKIGSSLVLKKVVDTTEDGKEKYKTQKFSKVKVSATAEDIYEIGKKMEELIDYPVKEILREDTSSVIGE